MCVCVCVCRGGDHVMMLLRPSTTGLSELHKCIVHSVMKDTVVLKMSKRTAEVWLVKCIIMYY